MFKKLLILLFCSSFIKTTFTISGSPSMKTLRVAGVNPALAVAVQDALKKTYRPNPNPLMNSFVCLYSGLKSLITRFLLHNRL